MTTTDNPFYDRPILNSPYQRPGLHWELDASGQPTQRVVERRRPSSYVTPVPAPKKSSGTQPVQAALVIPDAAGASVAGDLYDVTGRINRVRQLVDDWRAIPDENRWSVTPTTARLLTHWRTHPFAGIRPFYCQVEAVETAIWLTEVAPTTAQGRRVLDSLREANEGSNPGLMRIALKLATGAGKTTVMAMLIAWQVTNAVRQPQSDRFTTGFLVVTPGITIRDRLRVLKPNDPDAYYQSRELVPSDLLADMQRARVVITNYHAFQRRDVLELSKGTRDLLQGQRQEDPIDTRETEGQMLLRAARELDGLRTVVVHNDEAHHCYRAKATSDERAVEAGERDEVKRNAEAARVWISGIEAMARKVRRLAIFDLSATPFYLRGSGWAEGSLFPWTVSDFSLMDAIECGIVKLPRVPVADNSVREEVPVYRDLWAHVGRALPKASRSAGVTYDPGKLPAKLQSAIESLYGHYVTTFDAWRAAGIGVPPCFIVVCQNTAISKLVFDFVAGWERTLADGTSQHMAGRLSLFRNHEDDGTPLDRPRTLLIDSVQLDSGDALTGEFRAAAEGEIERFRRERVQRTGQQIDAADISDADVLREVMNTVGKPGQLGADIRCVVSVSMLTEGWDANTVTHVLGLRAFGTQLLCEQVIGRALRRQSYDLNDRGQFNVEYADVFGIPFDFTAQPPTKPAIIAPRQTVRVFAVRPDRDACEITFPRVTGYRVELPAEAITATFTPESRLRLTPNLVGPTQTLNEGIIGVGHTMDLSELGRTRPATIQMHLARHLLESRWQRADQPFDAILFPRLLQVVRQWYDGYFECVGDTVPAQLLYRSIADMVAEKVTAAITRAHVGTSHVVALIDPYNPAGTTATVNFTTSKTDRYETDATHCHVNVAILDSNWEGEFCRVIEAHPRLIAYVKNHGLGFEVPYIHAGEPRTYRPDYICLLDDGHGRADPLHLVVEISGYRDEEKDAKKATMEGQWVPGINHAGAFGRWAFAELTDVYALRVDLNAYIRDQVTRILQEAR